jgi:hypothetical protein
MSVERYLNTGHLHRSQAHTGQEQAPILPVDIMKTHKHKGIARLTSTSFPSARYEHQKNKTILSTARGNTATTAWQVAMLPTCARFSQYKMASDPVTASVEQGCVTKFLVREKVKPGKILCLWNEFHEEERLPHASVYNWYNYFSPSPKKF